MSEQSVTASNARQLDLTSCRAAARAHASRDLANRVRMLRRFGRSVLKAGDALVEAIVADTGKPQTEGWLHEVVPTADLIDFWCGEAPAHLGPHEPSLDALSYPGKRAVIERQPRGVIGLITPCNFPLALPLRTLFPALLTGNGVVFKSSERAPKTAALLAKLARESFGPDLVTHLAGGPDLVPGMIDAGLDQIVFVGGSEAGRAVAHLAAERLTPVALELGGNDAAIVLADAPVERTARGLLWGAFGNSGQNCAAIERVYAVKSIAPELLGRLVELTKELEPGRDFGPLATAAQRDRIEAQLVEARQAGAEVKVGGGRLDRDGHWLEPTVVELGAETGPLDLLREETFGPVLPLVVVKDVEEAVRLANEGEFGLTGSVWGKRLLDAEKVARRLRVGVATVNNHGFTGAIPSLPWGGPGRTGGGVTGSLHALEVVTRPAVVSVDSRRADREVWWFPYTPAATQLGRSIAIVRGGGGAGARVGAAFKAVGGLLRRWR